MSLITSFDDLPDLILIELFSYLSSFDILWGLTHLKDRLTLLLVERGFFNHINLSSAHYDQFNSILRFLPLNDIQSLVIDNDASPIQLTCWPYLPRLKTLRVIAPSNHDDLLLFVLLHAATLTHLIMKSNERFIPDGFSIKCYHPIGNIVDLIHNIFCAHLPALRSLDLGMNYYETPWRVTTTTVPLTYLRLSLRNMDSLVRLLSTSPLSQTLRRLHLKLGNSRADAKCFMSKSDLSFPMNNLHTFTLVQTLFSITTIEWTMFERLISSEIMPVLRRANVSIAMHVNDLIQISSLSLFTDHRHVDVHFAFHLFNCPQYRQVTQYIPCGNPFHPREIVGATFLVKEWSDKSKWLTDGHPFDSEYQDYYHVWYSLPWMFDEFFHEYIPRRWIIQTEVFQIPHKTKTINQSCLHTCDASAPTLSSPIAILPQILSSNCIETLHFSYWNKPIRICSSVLRNITLMNSIHCLNHGSLFPKTVRTIRILLFYNYPNYVVPNWSMVFKSLSTLSQLNSLRVFMYDFPPATIDDDNCKLIAKMAPLFIDFGFCFRYKFPTLDADADMDLAFESHAKFLTKLHDNIRLFVNKQPLCSIEKDPYGLIMWF